jgi:hypothetical protein
MELEVISRSLKPRKTQVHRVSKPLHRVIATANVARHLYGAERRRHDHLLLCIRHGSGTTSRAFARRTSASLPGNFCTPLRSDSAQPAHMNIPAQLGVSDTGVLCCPV